jgi:hypothetical protein
VNAIGSHGVSSFSLFKKVNLFLGHASGLSGRVDSEVEARALHGGHKSAHHGHEHTQAVLSSSFLSDMDYLRTLGSAAVSTLVQKSGLNLPFSIGVKVMTFEGICNLYDGTKRV